MGESALEYEEAPAARVRIGVGRCRGRRTSRRRFAASVAARMLPAGALARSIERADTDTHRAASDARGVDANGDGDGDDARGAVARGGATARANGATTPRAMDTEALKSLNPAHLKALLGQEVLMTLSDGTTRQGAVYSLDPESFTIVLATGTDGVRANGSLRDDACVIVPGHAVKAVEVVGGNALALDALSKTKTNGNGWMTSGGEQGDAMKKAMKSMSASRTNSWGANSTYAGMTALLKPSAGTQLERVKRCLRANMVPFTERPAPDGPGDVELLVLGSLVVSYPYTADSCACPNEIVLARVRELLTAGCPEVANGAQSVA